MGNHIFLKSNDLRSRTAFSVDTGTTASVIKVGRLKPSFSMVKKTVLLQGMGTLGKVLIYSRNGPKGLSHESRVVPNDSPCVGGILGNKFLEAKHLDVEINVGEYLLLDGMQWDLRRAQILDQRGVTGVWTHAFLPQNPGCFEESRDNRGEDRVWNRGRSCPKCRNAG
uniref:Uncharacterized protein n=1 Tax=Bracon brevicornis TaxID=1563983 RepID=A0A6V7L8K5_9HYME